MNTKLLHMGTIDGDASTIFEMLHDFVPVNDEMI